MLSPCGVSAAFGSPWLTALGSCNRLTVESFRISSTYAPRHTEHAIEDPLANKQLHLCCKSGLH